MKHGDPARIENRLAGFRGTGGLIHSYLDGAQQFPLGKTGGLIEAPTFAVISVPGMEVSAG